MSFNTNGLRKDDEHRSNRKPIVYDSIQIEWDGETRGPDLEEMAPDINWSDMTKMWWENWRNSAQAMVMHETDWFSMLETAFLHNRLWSTSLKVDKTGQFVDVPCSASEAATLSGEIRRRTEQYGATYADRKKYGMKITVDGRAGEAEVKQDAARVVNYLEQLTADVAAQKEGK